ncbi:hypothetical protein F5Y16DRAFT_367105 [Xylariaceae sp. FL0255]|nr:hypothetical protein F5Y16DRAFT_367105 [Xylariaceae sp. FL0255]
MLVTESATAQGYVSFLILGAGWTSTFLIPRLEREGINYAATTTDGRDDTIRFKFDPDSDDLTQFRELPPAKTVLITFPLKGEGQSARLVKMYAATHSNSSSTGRPHYIQLGVTSIWTASTWQDETSPYDKQNVRAIAEDELMAHASASVLSLAGLYGAARQPRDWVGRVVKSKDDLKAKGALHVIHGEDVARAIIALHRNFTPGKRWLLCDMHVYDWWDLVQDWSTLALRELEDDGAADATYADKVKRQRELLTWVGELMVSEDVRALPRDASAVGRRLDGRGFWNKMGIWPINGRIR